MVAPPRWKHGSFHHRGEPGRRKDAVYRTDTEILRERVRAGIAQARKEGRPHGRPRTASLKADQVLRLEAERVSHSEIARRLGIGGTSVRRILAAG
jgi:DNA invertase Pin-like site-specific DNA recombinase